MPVQEDGSFERIWRFVEYRAVGDKVWRADMDEAFDDFVAGLTHFGGIAQDALDLAQSGPQPYASRAAAVTASQDENTTANRIGWLDPNGQSRFVTRKEGATDIPDMPGWVPDGLLSPVSVFGGWDHGSMSAIDVENSVDSTAAIQAARAYAVANKKAVWVDGYYKYNGADFILAKDEKIIGPGRHKCGIQIWCDNTQTGAQIRFDNAHLEGLEIMAYLREAKQAGGGWGMIGNCLVAGSFRRDDPLQPKGFYLNDLLLTRKDNEPGYISYNSFAANIGGGCDAGYIGLIEVGTRHSTVFQSHWTGDFVDPGDPVTETVHPQGVTVKKLIVTGDSIGTLVTLSSTANMRIGSVVADTCRQILTILPGDELDDFNIEETNIGAGLRIDELVCNNMDTSQATGTNDDALSISSLGTSKFRTEEGEPRKEQMRMSVSIGTLTMHTDDPALVYGIDLFEYFGTFEVEHAQITGFKEAVRSRYSRGDIQINIDYTDGRCEVLDSDTVLTGAWDGGDPSGTVKHSGELNESRSVGVTSTYWSAAADIISTNDTSITVPTGIPADIPRGSTLDITGITNGTEQTIRMVADSFTESGLTVVELGRPIPHSMASVTLAYVGDCNVRVDAKQMTGARSGVLVDGGNVDVRGNIFAGRFNVHSINEKSVITYDISTPVSGLARENTESYTLYDLWFENGGTAIATGVVGAAKVGDHGAYYSLGATGTPSAKVHLKGARVIDPAKVIAVPEPEIDLTVTGSFTDAGAEYTILDALGLARTGNDANGYWRRNLDGTMDCWVSNFDIGTTQPYTWDFPDGGFIGATSTCVTVTSASSTAPRMGHGRAISATQAEVWIHNDDGTDTSNAGANIHAIGRWKA